MLFVTFLRARNGKTGLEKKKYCYKRQLLFTLNCPNNCAEKEMYLIMIYLRQARVAILAIA
jgi:hypothetical protein